MKLMLDLPKRAKFIGFVNTVRKMDPIQNLACDVDNASMPSRLLLKSCSDLSLSFHESDSAASPSSSSEMWTQGTPFLFSLLKEVNTAKAAESTAVLLPSQHGEDSRTDESAVRLLVPSCPAVDRNLNYRPVVGILSHPGDGASGRLTNSTNASYIAASYVKFVEAGGARVIPLIYNEREEILFKKLELVNGVLFTGGFAKRGLYYEVVNKIFKKALERNDAGEHFPVYAICLGFELLSIIISEDRSILQKFNAKDSPSPLQFVENFEINGTLFQRFPPDLLRKLSTDCLAMQKHRWGISPQRFLGNSALSSFFQILTTCLDEDNKAYVSTVQSQRYPVTAFQWHPEKNAFEWGMPDIPHSEDAVQVTQQIANYFISEARKSVKRPAARELLDNLIYNYNSTFCGYDGKGYDEVYLFTQIQSLI